MFKSILEFIISYWEPLTTLFIFCIIGAGDGVMESYLKHLDNQQTASQTISTAFWTKRKFLRFSYKFIRLLILFGILSVSFIAGLKVFGAIVSGGIGSINWHYAILIPSYKLYKVSTLIKGDVDNKTDEAANEASKLYSGYNTALTMFESIKGLNSATSENKDEKKDSTNDEGNENQ